MSEKGESEANGEGGPEAAPEQVTGKPGQFKKGTSGNPGGKPKDRVGTSKPAKLYLDMRAVYQQEREKDKGPGQRNCRTLLDENPKEFLAQLGRLEAAHRTAQAKGQEKADVLAGGGVKPDEAEERILELCERLLALCETDEND